MVCGPGEDGQRGERIPKGGKKGKGKAGCRVAFCCLLSSAFWICLLLQLSQGKGKDGKAQGERPQSRHMARTLAGEGKR